MLFFQCPRCISYPGGSLGRFWCVPESFSFFIYLKVKFSIRRKYFLPLNILLLALSVRYPPPPPPPPLSPSNAANFTRRKQFESETHRRYALAQFPNNKRLWFQEVKGNFIQYNRPFFFDVADIARDLAYQELSAWNL